jgi:Protein of unknown function (DUF2442)
MNPRVTKITPLQNHQMHIVFSNDEHKLFDFTPYLHYPIYEPLVNQVFFSSAKVLDGIVVWNDVIDFDPDRLYLESI